MKIDEFVVEFLLKDKGFNEAADKVDNKLDKIASTALKVGAALVTAFSAGKIKDAIDNATADVDKLGKTAEKLGVDFQELQELGFVAEQNGIKAETFNVALQRMTRRIAEAANTGKGEAVPALDALGLSAEKLNKLTAGDRLNAISDAMSKIPDQGERVRIAFKLFDTEGVDMVRTLQKGSVAITQLRQEARDLGIILGDDFPNKAAQYQDSMNRVNRIVGAVKNKILFELAPVIEEISEKFIAWWKINGLLITSRIVSFFSGMADVLSMVFFVISNLIKNVLFLVETLGGFEVILGILAIRSIPFLIAKIALLGKVLRATKFVALIIALDDLITHLRGGESYTGRFIKKLEEIHPVLGSVGQALAWVATGVGVLAFIPKGLAALMFVIKGIAGAVAAVAAGVSLPFLAIGAAIAGVVVLVVKYWDQIKSAGINAAKSVSNFFVSAIDGIKERFSKMVSFVTGLVPDFIKNGFGAVKGFVQNGGVQKAAQTTVAAASIGATVASASPSSISNSNSQVKTENNNQYSVEVNIAGDSSGLTESDVSNGVRKALEDVSVGGLRNNVGVYR